MFSLEVGALNLAKAAVKKNFRSEKGKYSGLPLTFWNFFNVLSLTFIGKSRGHHSAVAA